MAAGMTLQQTGVRVGQFYRLCKPRVVSLIVFTAIIGMCLACLLYTSDAADE